MQLSAATAADADDIVRRRGPHRRRRQPVLELTADCLNRRVSDRSSRGFWRREVTTQPSEVATQPVEPKASRNRSRNASIRQTGRPARAAGRPASPSRRSARMHRRVLGDHADRHVVAGVLAAHVAVRLVVAEHDQHQVRVGVGGEERRERLPGVLDRLAVDPLDRLGVAEDLLRGLRPARASRRRPSRRRPGPTAPSAAAASTGGGWRPGRSRPSPAAGRSARARGGGSRRACTGRASTRSRTSGPA